MAKHKQRDKKIQRQQDDGGAKKKPGLEELEEEGGAIDDICYEVQNGVYIVKVSGSGAVPNSPIVGYFTKDPSRVPAPTYESDPASADGNGDYEISFTIGDPPDDEYDLDIFIGQSSPDTATNADWDDVDAC